MKIKNRKLDEVWSKLLYVLLIVCVIACVCVVVFAIKGPRNSVLKHTQRVENLEISDASVTLKKTADYGKNYINSIIFLGDYSTSKMLELEILSGGASSYQIWTGESGDISLDANISNISIVFPDNGEVVKLSDALLRRSPKYLVVTLGINNGVSYCDKEKFSLYYQNIIDVIKESSPGTVVMIQSILPISKKAEKKNPSISNERIDRANEWLVEICQKNNLKFIYSADWLKDDSGKLLADYASDDGLSMNVEGYKQMLKYIRLHGYRE